MAEGHRPPQAADAQCPVCLDERADQHLLACLHRACARCVVDIDAQGGRCPFCGTVSDRTVPLLPSASDNVCGVHSLPWSAYCVACEQTKCPECRCRSHVVWGAKTVLSWLHFSVTPLQGRVNAVEVLLTELHALRQTLSAHVAAEHTRIATLLADDAYAPRRAALHKELDGAHAADRKLLDDDIASQQAVAERLRDLVAHFEVVFGGRLETYLERAAAAAQPLHVVLTDLLQRVPLAYAALVMRRAQEALQAPQHDAPLLQACSVFCVVEPVTPASAACACIGRARLYREKNFSRPYERIDLAGSILAVRNLSIEELPSGDLACTRYIQESRAYVVDGRTLKTIRVLSAPATRLRVCPAGLVWLRPPDGLSLHCTTPEDVHVRTICAGASMAGAIADFVIARSGLIVTLRDAGCMFGHLPDGTEVWRTTVLPEGWPQHFKLGPLLDERFTVLFPVYGASSQAMDMRCMTYDLATGSVARPQTRWLSRLSNPQWIVPVPGRGLLWLDGDKDMLTTRDWDDVPCLSTQPEGAVFWFRQNFACTFLSDGSLVAEDYRNLEVRLFQFHRLKCR